MHKNYILKVLFTFSSVLIGQTGEKSELLKDLHEIQLEITITPHLQIKKI